MLRALLDVIMLSLLAGQCLAAVYNVQAGAVSSNGRWLFSSLYPLAGLNPPFAIQVGDSIEFSCGGTAKTLVFTPRPYISLVNKVGVLDPSLSASGPQPVVLNNAAFTYSSGLLYPGENFTFTFQVEGTWPVFDSVNSIPLGSIVVQAAAAPYSTDEVTVFIADQVARDEAVAAGMLATATNTEGEPVGEIFLSWSSNSSRISLLAALTSLTEPKINPLSMPSPSMSPLYYIVYKDRPVTFINRDLRPWNIFLNSTGLFPEDGTFGGGPNFLLPSPSVTLTHSSTSTASSGMLPPGATWKAEFRETGDYHWRSSVTGLSGHIRVTNPPGSALPVGRVFASIFIVLAILVLIAIGGAACIIGCDYLCLARRKVHASVLTMGTRVGTMSTQLGTMANLGGSISSGIRSVSPRKKSVKSGSKRLDADQIEAVERGDMSPL